MSLTASELQVFVKKSFCFQDNSWTEVRCSFEPRQGGVAVFWDREVYILGGSSCSGPTMHMDCYNINLDFCYSKLRMLSPRSNLAACSSRGKIYTSGGATQSDEGDESRVFKGSTSSCSWQMWLLLHRLDCSRSFWVLWHPIRVVAGWNQHANAPLSARVCGSWRAYLCLWREVERWPRPRQLWGVQPLNKGVSLWSLVMGAGSSATFLQRLIVVFFFSFLLALNPLLIYENDA